MYFKLHLKMRRILFSFFHNKDKKVSSWAKQTTFTLVHIHEWEASCTRGSQIYSFTNYK